MGDSTFIPKFCLHAVCDGLPGAVDAIVSVFGKAKFASILIDMRNMRDAEHAKRCISAAQAMGAAALVVANEDAQVVAARALGADGVHLVWSTKIEEAYDNARQIFGPSGIVGIDAGTSRHDAMSVAEAGADYVAFGLDPEKDITVSKDERLELCEWWAEVFEVPVIALDVATPAEAVELVSARADFLCLKFETAAVDQKLQEIERCVRSQNLVETG